MTLPPVNPLAILVAGIVGAALGAFWYSSAGFGNAWLTALGKTQEELGDQTPALVASVVASFVSALAVAWVVGSLGVESLADGALVGLLLGVGLVATAMLSDYLFCGRSVGLYGLQVSYRVSYLVLMGAILGAWT